MDIQAESLGISSTRAPSWHDKLRTATDLLTAARMLRIGRTYAHVLPELAHDTAEAAASIASHRDQRTLPESPDPPAPHKSARPFAGPSTASGEAADTPSLRHEQDSYRP